MTLSREEQSVLDGFLSIVYRLDDSVIDRAILALVNEKKIKQKREAFIARLVRSGMSPEDAAEEVLNFQRESEGLAVSKKSLMDQKEWAVQTAMRIQERQQIAKSGSSEEKVRKISKPSPEHADDMDELIDEFEKYGGEFKEEDEEEEKE